MNESVFAIDFDLLVNDFILPCVGDDEIFNTENITSETRWYLMTSELSISKLISEGYPLIHNTYGMYLGLKNNEPVPDSCVSYIPTTSYSFS